MFKSLTFNSLIFGTCCLVLGLLFFSGCTTLSRQQRKNATEDKLTQAINCYERGLTLEQDGKAEAAVAEYKKAIDLNPRPAAYYHLGLIYAAKAEYTTAIANFEKAIALVPTYDAALKELDRIKSISK